MNQKRSEPKRVMTVVAKGVADGCAAIVVKDNDGDHFLVLDRDGGLPVQTIMREEKARALLEDLTAGGDGRDLLGSRMALSDSGALAVVRALREFLKVKPDPEASEPQSPGVRLLRSPTGGESVLVVERDNINQTSRTVAGVIPDSGPDGAFCTLSRLEAGEERVCAWQLDNGSRDSGFYLRFEERVQLIGLLRRQLGLPADGMAGKWRYRCEQDQAGGKKPLVRVTAERFGTRRWVLLTLDEALDLRQSAKSAFNTGWSSGRFGDLVSSESADSGGWSVEDAKRLVDAIKAFLNGEYARATGKRPPEEKPAKGGKRGKAR